VKKILIVDKDNSTLTALSEGFDVYKNIDILTAESAKLAANMLNILNINLVVVTVNMNSKNDFRLLSYIHKKFPSMPVVIMTESEKSQIEARVKPLGYQHILEKTTDTETLSDIFFTILDSTRNRGKIQGIALSSLLQLIELEEKSCTLRVNSGEKTGFLYCRGGELIAAQAGRQKGKKAALEIICWDQSIIQIEDSCRFGSREIDIPLMALLMESQKQKDEGEIFFSSKESKKNHHSDSLDSQKSESESTQTAPGTEKEMDGLFSEKPNEALDNIFKNQGGRIFRTFQKNKTVSSKMEEMARIIHRMSGWDEYAVYGPDDTVKIKSSKKTNLFVQRPSDLFTLGRDAGKMFSFDNLDYMIFVTKKGYRCALIHHDRFLIAVSYGFGFSLKSLMQNIGSI
jgi:CheY-like chemotaxis protein